MKDSEYEAIDELEGYLPKSKSQIKREMHELQALGKQLVELPTKQLVDIPLSEKIRDTIVAAKTLKHGAIRRQLQYIGRLMQKEAVESFFSACTLSGWRKRRSAWWESENSP